MAKKEIIGYLKLSQVPGGNANPGGGLGPALGSKGINIMDFCSQFNARTQDKKGEQLSVLITLYKDKSFDFVIKSPPAFNLLIKIASIKKGSSEPNRKKVANITWNQIKEIAEIKKNDLNSFSIESAMKMISGTARSAGITITGTPPWENKIL